jgi:predicted MPP superfamily phosphohydrolase
MTSILAAFASLVGAGAAATGYAYAEARAYTLRQRSVPLLDSGELRILHISDLHLTPAQTRKIQWVSTLADCQPDLVMVTGDFLAHSLAVPAVAEALGGLLEIPGVFVFGSNDYFAPERKNPLSYLRRTRAVEPQGAPLPTEDLRTVLTAAGWLDANNAEHMMTVNGIRLHIRGTDDAHIGNDRYLSGLFDPGALAIGITHAPYRKVTEAMAADGAALVLAGHTHGGQVCLPFYGALVTNCDLPRDRAKGLSFIGDGRTLLHVSAGVGTSPYTPIRLACRPEATLLTLTTVGDDDGNASLPR